MHNGFRIYDRLVVRRIDDNGNIINERRTFDNTSIWDRILRELGITRCFADDLVTNAGLADVAALIRDRYDYMSIGTGFTPPEVTDTQLESEIYVRALCTKTLSTTFSTDDTVVFTGSFLPPYNIEVSECGLHTTAGPTNDILFARETFKPIEFVADQTTQLVWSVILTR